MRGLFLYTFYAFTAICFLTTSYTPAYSMPAPTTYNNQEPLLIIRFGEKPVDYEQILDKTVKMALNAKPAVSFDIVALTPDMFDRKINKQNEKDAKSRLEKISVQIQQAGVSAERINTSFKLNKLTQINEIQIFVK